MLVQPHRSHLRANAGPQKLFVLLKLLPSNAAAQARPDVHLAIVVDTSGSMRRKIDVQDSHTTTARRISKLSLAMEAAEQIIDSTHLRATDVVSVIQFDAEARLSAHGQVGANRADLVRGIRNLTQHSGVTRMNHGLWSAEHILSVTERPARKVLLLTDGQTLDTDDCVQAARVLGTQQTPIVALGLGETYNELLLRELSNLTLGRPFHLRDASGLPALFAAEVGAVARQVLTDVTLNLKTPRDVRLASITRVYPSIADVSISQDNLRLGPVEAGDFTVYVLELDLPGRPPTGMRVAQLGVSYSVPAQRINHTETSHDIVVSFTKDEAQTVVVDAEVMGYVQQRNTDTLIQQAATIVRRQPEQATQLLAQARKITEQFGNTSMTIALGRAENELVQTGRMSVETLKTIHMGVRTQTVKLGSSNASMGDLSNADIRRLTGT